MTLEHIERLFGGPQPVGGSTGLVDVLDGGDEILVHPGVVGVLDTVLGADLTHLGCNVWVPGTGHAGEQVVLHLEVEASGDGTGNESTVGRGSLHLGLEPAGSLVLSVASAVGRITVDVFKVVRKGKQDCQSQTGGGSHDHDVSKNGWVPSLLDEWGNTVGVNVKKTQGDGVLSALSDVRVVHADSNFLGSSLLKDENLRVEDGRKPVSGQDENVVKGLELVHERTLFVARWVIVPEDHRLGSVTIRILKVVVGEGVVSPVLFHPQPLASSDEIGSKSKKIVDPRLLRGSSVVGIVLDVQTDERLRDTIDDGHGVGGNASNPVVLHGEEETNVKESTGKVSGSSEFTSTSDNLEDFSLNFTLERSVPNVSVTKEKEKTSLLA